MLEPLYGKKVTIFYDTNLRPRNIKTTGRFLEFAERVRDDGLYDVSALILSDSGCVWNVNVDRIKFEYVKS